MAWMQPRNSQATESVLSIEERRTPQDYCGHCRSAGPRRLEGECRISRPTREPGHADGDAIGLGGNRQTLPRAAAGQVKGVSQNTVGTVPREHGLLQDDKVVKAVQAGGDGSIATVSSGGIGIARRAATRRDVGHERLEQALGDREAEALVRDNIGWMLALAELDALVQSFVDDEEVVGAELLVLKNGKTILHEAYGWRDLDDPDAASPAVLDSVQVFFDNAPEFGESCDPPDGVLCDENCMLLSCGNGMLDGGESCDDGNDDADDGCSAACEREEGWTCTLPGVACVATECGDGIVAGFEQCDDANGECSDFHGVDITLGPDWQHLDVGWGDLQQEGWGQPFELRKEPNTCSGDWPV